MKKKKQIQELGWSGVLRDSGVGGMRPEGLVKCLHIHLAHELGARHSKVSKELVVKEEEEDSLASGANLVGLWVVEALKSVGVDGL
jgi:hypothetical protein